MVMGGQPVHLIHFFLGKFEQAVIPVICAYTFACDRQQSILNESAEGRSMTIEIIS